MNPPVTGTLVLLSGLVYMSQHLDLARTQRLMILNGSVSLVGYSSNQVWGALGIRSSTDIQNASILPGFHPSCGVLKLARHEFA